MGYRNRGPELPASVHLPQTLYKMFAPKREIPMIPKIEPTNYKRKIEGVAAYLHEFSPEPEEKMARIVKRENIRDVRKREKEMREEKNKRFLERKIQEYNPKSDAKKNPDKYTSDALNTLFVGRLNYDTTEERILEVFSAFGKVKDVKLVKDHNGRSRGYAFIEFALQSDMKEAYRKGNRMELDGRSILTDVERGRTSRDWKPKRLGGGLGGSSHKDPKKKGR